MPKNKFHFFLVFFLFIFTSAHAHPQTLNLDLQDTNLADAVRLMAKFLRQNIVISPTVSGRVTLHLHEADSARALEMLLTSQGLAKWEMGNIWFVAPREELIKRKTEEVKWETVREESLPLATALWRIKYGKAEDTARMLQDEHASLLSKRGHVRVDKRTNMLCVQDTEEHIRDIRRVIQQLDAPAQQITIEARLASVDNDFERELGIDFSVRPPSSEVSGTPGRYSIAVAALPDGSKLDVKLAALENAGHAEIISNPSLFTSNHQPASIEAGEEIPYQEVSRGGGTAVVFKKAVLGLKVTPQILPGNNVLLLLQINQDRPSSKMVLGMPVIRTREINTSVLVKNGKTVVLGGIYETNRGEEQQRVPFISQLPLLGWLFNVRNTRENKRELLIFVTPRIMTQPHEHDAE